MEIFEGACHGTPLFLVRRGRTRCVLLIVVVEILRFGASATNAQDNNKEEGRHDGKRKSSGTKPMLHKKERTA
jgi:hypothetical protein